MAEKEVLLTPDGLSKLEKELDHLKTVKRREVAARIKQALEFGEYRKTLSTMTPKTNRPLSRAESRPWKRCSAMPV